MENAGIWFLQNIDATEIFCPTKLKEEHSHPDHLKEYAKGQTIYFPEDQADKIYFIQEGRVKIVAQHEGGKEIIKAILGKGEIFGELSLVSDSSRRDAAVAMEQSYICVVDRDEISQLMPDRSGLQHFFLQLFGARILEMEKRIESLVFKDSRSRILHFLLDLVEKKGQPVGVETVVRKFFTHQEIANLTATSRQTVTTVLNELRNADIIKFDRRRLLVRDLPGLRSAYQGTN